MYARAAATGACSSLTGPSHGWVVETFVHEAVDRLDRGGEPSDKRRLLPKRMGSSRFSVLVACRPPHARSLVANPPSGQQQK